MKKQFDIRYGDNIIPMQLDPEFFSHGEIIHSLRELTGISGDIVYFVKFYAEGLEYWSEFESEYNISHRHIPKPMTIHEVMAERHGLDIKMRREMIHDLEAMAVIVSGLNRKQLSNDLFKPFDEVLADEATNRLAIEHIFHKLHSHRDCLAIQHNLSCVLGTEIYSGHPSIHRAGIAHVFSIPHFKGRLLDSQTMIADIKDYIRRLTDEVSMFEKELEPGFIEAWLYQQQDIVNKIREWKDKMKSRSPLLNEAEKKFMFTTPELQSHGRFQ